MRNILKTCVKIMLVSLMVGYGLVGVAQEATPTPITVPEGYFAEIPSSFPTTSIFCEEATRIEEGATWNDITIGISTKSELLTTLENMNDYTIIIDENQVTAIVDDGEMHRQEPSIATCIYGDIVTVLHLSYRRPVPSRIYWDNFLLEYGEPDTVTWAQGFNTIRILFWFEEGLALQVSNLEEPGGIGIVGNITFFSPIDLEDYEDNYPYNRTWFPDTLELEDIYGEQNPFDFDSIIATITAEPSQIPTATVMPMPTMTESP